MERIKDFFFDLSDVLISLIIVAVIFFVISWKLTETMPMSFSLFEPSDDNVSPPISESIRPTEPVSIVVQETTEVPTESASDIQPTTTPPTLPVKRVTIEIPSGSSGDAIAKILKNSGLVDNISAFNRTVESLALGNKLRAGSFTLSTDMSLETIARRIAGYKN